MKELVLPLEQPGQYRLDLSAAIYRDSCDKHLAKQPCDPHQAVIAT